MPAFTPVELKTSLEEHFGDMLMVIEFVSSFAGILKTKNFFPSGLTLDMLENSLIHNEVNFIQF